MDTPTVTTSYGRGSVILGSYIPLDIHSGIVPCARNFG